MKIEGILIEAQFIERLNRFEAIIEINGVQELTHIPNTGRLRELLVQGAFVLVRKFSNPSRKTQFGLMFVKQGEIWVSIDSANIPNKIMYEALIQKRLEMFRDYEEVKREVQMYNSRFDFGLFSEGHEYYIEVKGVTLVEDRKAFFPDAPTSRGTRHLEELSLIRQSGKGAGVVFIIQREDADVIRPNDKMDKEFGHALREAKKTGVDVYAYVLKIDIESKQIDIVRQVPVVL